MARDWTTGDRSMTDLFAVDRKKSKAQWWNYLRENKDPYYMIKDRLARAELIPSAS